MSKKRPSTYVRSHSRGRTAPKKKVDTSPISEVGSTSSAAKPNSSAMKPDKLPVLVPEQSGPPVEVAGEKTMTLKYKGLSKSGKDAIYTGAAASVRFPLNAFANKQAPDTVEVSGPFAEPKPVKAKMTPEERAAEKARRAEERKNAPKPTLAEKIARREAQLAKDKAKLAAQGASL